MRKIHVRERPKRRIFALTGPRGMADKLIEWYEAGHDPRAVPPGPSDGGWSLAIIEPDGSGGWRVWHIGSNCPYPTAVEVPFAWGSGSDYAKGVLHAGHTAKEAVEVACKLDTHSGGEIQVENIAEALGREPAPRPSMTWTKPDKAALRAAGFVDLKANPKPFRGMRKAP